MRKTNLSGLCWLDEKKNHWVWLDNEFENNTLHAQSTGGGSFVAVVDHNPPIVTGLNIIDKKTYFDQDFSVRMIMDDTLSGIADDRSILIRIDNEWLLPEYDPESGELVAVPKNLLKEGKHHLGIEIKDKVGNTFEKYLNFAIREKKSRNLNNPKGN